MTSPMSDSDVSEESSQDRTAGRWPGIRRRLGRALWCVVLLQAAYLVAANWLLRSSWLEERLQRPRRTQVEWQSASTWWPGQLDVHGLSVRHASKRTTWQLDLERAKARFGLWALLDRRVHLRSVKGRGYDLRLRQEDAPDAVAAAQPEIPPLTPSRSSDAGQGSAPPGTRSADPWRIEVGALRLREPRRLWLGPYRLTGGVEIDTAFDAVPRGDVEVQPSRLRLQDASLTFADRPLADQLNVTLDVALAPFAPREHRGKAVLSFASGRLQVEGRFAGLGLLDAYLRPYPWLQVQSTGGPLSGEVVFAAGNVIEGSRLTMGALPVQLGFYGGRASGTAQIEARVQPLDDALEYLLEIRIEEARAGAVEDGVIVAEMPLLEVVASDSAFHLVHGFSEPTLRVQVPEAVFPDLGFVDEHLPSTAGLSVRRGVGRMAMHFEATSERLHGQLHVAGNDLDLVYRDQPFKASAVFDATLEGGDLQRGRFGLSDATLQLDSSTRWHRKGSGEGNEQPWRGELELADGSLQVIDPWHLTGELQLQLTDTAPLFALYLHERRLLKHFQRALTVRDVHGTAELRAGRRRLALRDMDLDGEHLQVLGQLDLTEAPPNGLLWARFHGLSAALELKAGKKDVQLIRPRRWYDARLAAWRSR